MGQCELEMLYSGMLSGDQDCIREIVKKGAYMLRALTQSMGPDLAFQEQLEVTKLMLGLASLIEAGRLQIKNAEDEK